MVVGTGAAGAMVGLAIALMRANWTVETPCAFDEFTEAQGQTEGCGQGREPLNRNWGRLNVTFFDIGHYQLSNTPHRSSLPRRFSQHITANPRRLKENAWMIRRKIRQWANKLLEALRHAVSRSTTRHEVIIGAILGFVLVVIMTFLGFFDWERDDTRWFLLRFLFRLGARDRVLSGESPLLSRAEPGRMGAYKLNEATTWARLRLRAVQKPKIETE